MFKLSQVDTAFLMVTENYERDNNVLICGVPDVHPSVELALSNYNIKVYNSKTTIT